MVFRLFAAMTIVAMLWTGTLWHDFFGTQVLPELLHVSQSVGEDSDLCHAASLSEKCPCPGHVHSPWSVSRVENPVAAILTTLAFALPAERQFSVDDILLASTAPLRAPPSAVRQPKTELFIVNRTLLI